MAKTLNRSARQVLSILFHLMVLTGMVFAYDAALAAARERGLLPPPKEKEVEQEAGVKGGAKRGPEAGA